MEKKKWSDLPPELLLPIADSLGLIELLSFRGACKDWNSASATASAQTESSHEPWFLVYGENSECLLLSNSGKKYTLNVPELNGTTCLASNRGWLLMFHNGSMFFFCPFSHAKIDLPKFPHSEITDHVAAFSSPPTSQDCVIAVISSSSESELEVNMLQRGANTWTNHKSRGGINTIKGVTYHDGAFNFCDTMDGLVSFSVKDQSWIFFQIVYASKENSKDLENLPFTRRMREFRTKDMNNQLGFSKDVSISTCGTQVHCESLESVIFNESIEAADKSKIRHLKGVWIQPRFFQVSPTQTW